MMINLFTKGFHLMVVAVATVLAASIQVQAAGPPPQAAAAPPASQPRALLDRYCVGCHNQRLQTAGLALDTVDVGNVGAAAPVWEKVVQKLRSGAMPPPGRPRPDTSSHNALASFLETELDRTAAARPNPGRPPIHRLNRTEYANVIRDLLALEIDGRSLLPADDAGYGFDNNADVLTISPGLLNRYMSAARKISRLAIGDPSIRPIGETYQVSSALTQDDRMSEDLPFGSRGGIAIRHYFPLDGEYRLKLRLQRVPASGAIRGLTAETQQLDVRLDGERVVVFTVGGPSKARPMARPTSPDDTEYKVDDADAGLEVHFPAKAGTRTIGVSFLKGQSATEGMGPTSLPVWTFGSGRVIEKMGLDSVHIEGPHNTVGPGETPSRAQILVCRPTGSRDEESCAKTILATLARRAYRRPVTDKDVQTLLGFYKAARATGGFEAGIQGALESILIDPEFLFRIERDPAPGTQPAVYRLSDLELASRLSFFLWSSIPDDELLDVAARGKLKDPAVLEQQVRRMLADSRSSALVSNFAAQWLHLRNLRAVTPDVNAFPEFDDNLRYAFQRETELFVESQLREDRSVSDLLTANYTFVNERLARHYGIDNVYGNRFRRVTFDDDKRGGLLGHGSILTVTSYATRTSPVVRGKWLLENILGAPPPPPPPDVPGLPDTGDGGKRMSVRERMERHRANPVCASCHARMDPLGFALENYDGIGKWRDTGESNVRIDASGTLPDGSKFQGPAELRTLLRSRRDEFVGTVTTKLLTYALGRGVEYYDLPTVRQIMREAASSDYHWSSIVLGIVKSMPFQVRSSES
jgi:mono/diheme cytochrome c family protein